MQGLRPGFIRGSAAARVTAAGGSMLAVAYLVTLGPDQGLVVLRLSLVPPALVIVGVVLALTGVGMGVRELVRGSFPRRCARVVIADRGAAAGPYRACARSLEIDDVVGASGRRAVLRLLGASLASGLFGVGVLWSVGGVHLASATSHDAFTILTAGGLFTLSAVLGGGAALVARQVRASG